MEPVLQKPYNLFGTPKLSRTVQVYDHTKSFEDNVAGKGIPSAQNIAGAFQAPQAEQHLRPQQQTVPLRQAAQEQPITSTEDLAAALARNYTSPEQEEKLRKASVMNQRILAIGDAVRHIGNIANTVNWAPAQQLNSPVLEEQARYEKGKALRDKANLTYLNYQQAKAAQDAKQRQWEATFNYNAEKDAANAKALKAYRDAKMKADRDKWGEQLAFNKKKWEDQSDLNERKFKQRTNHDKTMEGIASRNATGLENYRQWRMKGGGGSGSGVPPLSTPKGPISPSGKNYSNQLLQMWGYARDNGLLQETDQMRRLRSLGLSREADDMKRQQVLDLLRTNQALGDYGVKELNWKYGDRGGGSMNLGLMDDEEDDEEDGMDLGLD